MQQWLQNLPDGQLAEKRALWQSLASEPQSGELFELLNRLATSYQGEEHYADLQLRVWRMLEAASGSTELRRNCSSWREPRRVRIARRCRSATWKSD